MKRRILAVSLASAVLYFFCISLSDFTTLSVKAGPPPTPDVIPVYIIPSEHQFGSYSLNKDGIVDLTGLVVDANQQIYISDCFFNRIQVLSKSGQYIGAIPSNPTDGIHLNCPKGMAITPDNRLLVVNGEDRSVQAYELSGKFEKTVINDKRLHAPYAVAVSKNYIAVSDPGIQAVHLFSASGKFLRSCGTAGEAVGEFAEPLGISFAPDETFYVADQQNARIQQLRLDCSVVQTFGKYGSQAGELAEPADVRYNNGNVYVADLTNHRIQVFDETGNFLYQWGRHPSHYHEGNGRTHYPTFVATDPTGSFTVVCEPIESRCQTFNLDFVRKHVSTADDPAYWNKFPRFHYGTGVMQFQVVKPENKAFTGMAIAEPDTSMVAVLKWNDNGPVVHAMLGGFGSVEGRFKQPSGMAFDPKTNEIYISDSKNHRVQVFNILDGKFIRTFGTFGDALGYMNGPAGLDFNDEGNLLIAQAHANRVDVYSKEGEYLNSIGEPGSGPLQFNLPLGVKYNSRLKRIYVNDVYNHRIQILNYDGRYISEFSGKGTESGQINDSIQVAIDDNNNVYLADTSTSRILKFNQDGKLIKQWGEWGSELGQLYKPKGVTVMNDRLYVIDFGNHRGQIFTFEGEPLGIFGEGVLYPVAEAVLMPSEAESAQQFEISPPLVVALGLLALVATGVVIGIKHAKSANKLSTHRRTVPPTVSGDD
jgi:tripartite motif-containing protein 71